MRNDKREKYVNLVSHLKETSKGWVDFVPIVIGATGAVTKDVSESVKRLEVDLDLKWLQKITAVSTVNIFRQLL